MNQVSGIALLSQSMLLTIIECIPSLAMPPGGGFIDDKLGALCMQWLKDDVYLIHVAAANNLKCLAEEYGPEWAMQRIISLVLDLRTRMCLPMGQILLSRDFPRILSKDQKQVSITESLNLDN